MVSLAGCCAFKWEWRFHRQLFVGNTRAQAAGSASNIGHKIRVELSFGLFTEVRVVGLRFHSAPVNDGRV